jgi:hypothetical protein
MDINGDNRTDLTWSVFNGSQLQSWIMNADGTLQTGVSSLPPSYKPDSSSSVGAVPYELDLNGDGIADFLFVDLQIRIASVIPLVIELQTLGTRAIWLGNGDGTFRQVAGADTSVRGYFPRIMDVNGDGNRDILWDYIGPIQLDHSSPKNVIFPSQGRCILWLSCGDGTFDVQIGVLDGTVVGALGYVRDFNGDGKDDILWSQVDGNPSVDRV